MNEYDLIVIGSGSGGSATANRAAEHGAKVAVVEEGILAGTCVNRGCVPKKLTWYASRVHEAIHKLSQGYGFNVKDVSFNYQTFLEYRDGYIHRSRQSYRGNFDRNGVDLIQGHGQLKGKQKVQVGDQIYHAKHILIATGARPMELGVPGQELLETSDDFFNWQALPESVAIVGAGYIAVELAQVLNGLGVETHLVVRHDRPLRRFDAYITDHLLEFMADQGIHLHSQTEFDSFKEGPDKKIECYQAGQHIISVNRVIQAIGRKPNTKDLGLENTRVTLDEDGFIEVDNQHQSHEPGVYALGDVIRRPQLTPVAIKAGRTLAEYLFNQASDGFMDYEKIPTVVFSHPAIGAVGLSESQAVEKYGQDRIKVYTNKFFSMYASGGGSREACYFKLVCLDAEEYVVGLHGIGEGVDEMIQGFALAMKMKARKSDFDSVVAIHPTGAEEFVTMR